MIAPAQCGVYLNGPVESQREFLFTSTFYGIN